MGVRPGPLENGLAWCALDVPQSCILRHKRQALRPLLTQNFGIEPWQPNGFFVFRA